MICDPGTRTFEGSNVGLFYTALSRATTGGRWPGDPASAIFFTGENMTEWRVTNLDMRQDGKWFAQAERRNQWLDRLAAQETMTEEVVKQAGLDKPAMKKKVITWALKTEVGRAQLEECILNTRWRTDQLNSL